MEKQLYINGEWKNGVEYVDLFAPHSGEKLAQIPQATKEDVESAISAAKNAQQSMGELTAYQRGTILEQLVNLLIENRDKLAEIVALEASKPLKVAYGEIDRTIATYKIASEEAKRIYGETLPLDAVPGGEGRVTYTVREPIGVIGAITPFNFPFNLVAHKVGPAIASGNTIVLKPASQTPLSALALAELIDQTDLPKGAFNIVTGKGSIVGDALVNHPDVKAITFTGSPEVGIALKNKAGLKRVTLELGSNSALIIDQGVQLTDELINRCVWGSFVYNGQVCISLQRIYVHESLMDEFLLKVKDATEQLKIGSPLDSNTDISALISKKDVERIEQWVRQSIKDGAKLVTGGKKIDERIFAPTVLANVKNSCEVVCHEVFGPVVTVNSFEKLEEAFEEVNNSRYGLQAGIFTDNIRHALLATKKLHVGGVLINDVPTFRVDLMPYGGVKESGYGREGIKYAIQEMTELKMISIKM
ncbi:aldehyde dehydrogenase family protein [Bacillus sp. RG28]|uniref:Aldehyde dehydrogenase family protein n=1 Tax=Gottfriedia endophytica TaxID=2820819 RepID=A0A940NS87_9BACI|nr:aldehyde dehydrogenase family protein [Gottfriedia endophytica]MBP0725876.1 aldehyde dehydrogenase family protein [Gottfriedia endophytica]